MAGTIIVEVEPTGAETERGKRIGPPIAKVMDGDVIARGVYAERETSDAADDARSWPALIDRRADLIGELADRSYDRSWAAAAAKKNDAALIPR
jgi:hypothetical protein